MDGDCNDDDDDHFRGYVCTSSLGGLPVAPKVLAAGILASVKTPEQLASIKILVPSRRAAQALRTAFIQQAEGQALLLPNM